VFLMLLFSTRLLSPLAGQPGRSRRGMDGLHVPVLALAGMVGMASAVSSSGCRYQNMNAVGRVSAAPFEQLECNESGNEEGFSFMIPACECNSGIRMRYRASFQAGGRMLVRLEYEAGTDSEETSDDTRVVLAMDGSVESVEYGGRRLPPRDECCPVDRAIWVAAADGAVLMWDNYMPLLDMMLTTCVEDRVDAESD
jgi:hypothetical protein